MTASIKGAPIGALLKNKEVVSDKKALEAFIVIADIAAGMEILPGQKYDWSKKE